MKYRELKDNVLSVMCRRCINEEYGLELMQEDCYYLPFPDICPHCGQVRNIVGDIRPVKKMKALLLNSEK